MLLRNPALALAPAAFVVLAPLASRAEEHRAGSEGEGGDGRAKRRLDWYVLPNVAFDTDDGLGFGVRGEVAVPEEGYEPYREAYVIHAFASLRNFHHHRFRYDRTGLGRSKRLRVTLHVAYRQWGNDGYWGIGPGTVREREFVGSFERDDPRRTRYRYDLIQPFVHFTLRASMGRGLALFVSLNGKWTWVRTYPGSLLEEQLASEASRPYGADGGLTVLLSSGLLYDSRRPEVDPRRGVLAEASGQWALPLPWGPGRFGGAFFSLRAFFGLTRWMVLATRLMAEFLGGEVPFYEMTHWRSSVPIAGFGGFETLRGVSFGRWRAPCKAVLNLELRFTLGQHQLFRRPLVWQLAAFGDAGAVWGAGDAATAPQVDLFPLRASGGLGVRLVYASSFVARLDAGLSNDPVVEPTGEVSNELQWGLYLVFDHAF
jgi:outer membrane protein assembly factor BamA